MRSRVLAPGTTVMAAALTLGLTGCEATKATSQPRVEATDQPRVEAAGQPPEAATGQPPEVATGQPPVDVQPEAREDDDRRLRTLPAFRALDTDDDGEISAGEIDAASASLASLDDDGDGRLSRDELRPRQDGPHVFFGSPANLPEGTRMMPLGADEELDIADLPPQLRSLLSPADGDGDGKASGLELLAAMMAAQGGEPGNREPWERGRDGSAVAGHRERGRWRESAGTDAPHGGARREPGRHGLGDGDRIGGAVAAPARRRRRRAHLDRRASARFRQRFERQRSARVNRPRAPASPATRGRRRPPARLARNAGVASIWIPCFGMSAPRRGGSLPSADSPSPCSSPSPSASAPTLRCSASSTLCSCGPCPIRTPSASCGWESR